MKMILVFVAFAVAAFTIGLQQTKIKTQQREMQAKIDSLTHLSDSLHWELFPVQIELGRYQVAYEIFSERNPKAAEQYGTIISEETE